MRGRACFDRVERLMDVASLLLSLAEDALDDLLVCFFSFGLAAGGITAGGGILCSSSSSDTSNTRDSIGIISTESRESLLCEIVKSEENGLVSVQIETS